MLEAGGRGCFGTQAVLEDLSAGGFRLRLARPFARGERLLIVAQVAHALVALRGRVLRAEPQSGGWRLAAAVAQYKIFPLTEAKK